MTDEPTIPGSEVSRLKDLLDLSAEKCARVVGLKDGAGWRRWERDGVKGTAAVLVNAMIELPALRRFMKSKLKP